MKRYSSERHKIKIEAQHMQYHEVVKVSCILFLISKVDILEWTKFLVKPLKAILGSKVMFILAVLKINYGIIFKDNNKRQESMVVKIRIDKNIRVHAERIKK